MSLFLTEGEKEMGEEVSECGDSLLWALYL